MSFGLKLRGIPRSRIEQIVQSAAEKLEIQMLLERRPKDLSGGQRQRVAMGRAMVREPQVFLFDEPLSNLDARLREQMRYEIRKLQRDLGTTSIYVTHDQIEAMTMADRIVAMHDGIAQQIGTPAELYGNPANLFVAGFIGTPAMNFLDGIVRDQIDLMVGPHRLAQLAAPRAIPTDGRVIVGIRPERISLSEPTRAVAAQVDLLEPTGLGTILHLRIAAQRIKVFTTERVAAGIGDVVGISVKAADVLLFDPGTGLRLS